MDGPVDLLPGESNIIIGGFMIYHDQVNLSINLFNDRIQRFFPHVYIARIDSK